MDLQKYYNEIKKELSLYPDIDIELEAQNYILYKYMLDKNDSRISIFDKIYEPKTKINFEEKDIVNIMSFLITLKN